MNRGNLIDLSDEFYTQIPHDFGFSKMHNHIIDTVQKVKIKVEMLESLSEIKLATTLLNASESSDNQIDANYKKLNRKIEAIEKKS